MDKKENIQKNKRAYFDYFVIDTYEVGIVLKGTEIKSIRDKKVSLDDNYCTAKNGELFIYNMNISKYEKGNIFNHKEKEVRKLLAHKNEIRKLTELQKQDGYTLIALELYIINGKAKILLGVCKGKKNYDKREVLKENELKKTILKNIKTKY